MKIALKLNRDFAWIKLPSALLILLLQRSPVASLIQIVDEFVAESPIGAVLKSVAATVASLGALNSLAGATALSTSQPSPLTAKTGTAITPVAVTVTNTINIASWKVGGTLPPGMMLIAQENPGIALTGPGTLDATTAGTDDGYGDVTMGIVSTTPVLMGTPTAAGNFTFTMQAFEFAGLSGLASDTFNFSVNVTASAIVAAPTFATQPQNQTVTAGTAVTFTSVSGGTPTPTFQWSKNGVAIAGATGTSLTLNNVAVADSGTYTVAATNSAGSATSSAVLTVNAPAGGAVPAITAQPLSIVAKTGGTAALSVGATSAGTYQWSKDGAQIAGATNSTLVLSNLSTANAGNYTVAVTNPGGSVTTTPAALSVSNTTNFGRLINLSILTTITADTPFFTVGTVLGGAGTGGQKPLLVRAVGPSLSLLGVGGPLADPKLDFYSGNTIMASNDNWNGDPQIAAVETQLGAFQFASPTSKDAAVVFTTNVTPPAGFTVQVSGVGGATGVVLAELYDATAVGAVTPSTPRLINLSVLKNMSGGELLTAGFVIRGDTACTVLLRAVGPGLTALGVPGVMGDPQLSLFNSSQAVIASNDNWGGSAQITNVGSSVGAFTLADPNSKDAVLLITLPAGNYTMQVTGANGTAGQVVVEAYEVP